MSGSRRYVDALESFHAMLSSYPTHAEIASIHTAVTPERQVTVTLQLQAAEPVILAAGLVEWERTLGRTETWAWCTLNGKEAHVALVSCGDLPITVVAGPFPYDDGHLDYDLEPGLPAQLDTEILYRWLGTEITRTWPFTTGVTP